MSNETKQRASEGDDQSPEFLAVWNSPDILKARRALYRRNGLRKWFEAAIKERG